MSNVALLPMMMGAVVGGRLAADYTPPPGFENWFANAFYLIGIVAAVVHIWNSKQARSVKIEGNIATTAYVDKMISKLLSASTFDDYKETAERDRSEIRECLAEVKDEIEKVDGKIEKFSGDNYKARRALHGKVNAQSNALYFIAGQHQRGPEIKAILDRAHNLNTESDGE